MGSQIAWKQKLFKAISFGEFDPLCYCQYIRGIGRRKCNSFIQAKNIVYCSNGEEKSVHSGNNRALFRQ